MSDRRNTDGETEEMGQVFIGVYIRGMCDTCEFSLGAHQVLLFLANTK